MGATGAVTITAGGGSAPSASALPYFTVPSLADEVATYSLLGWSELAGAQSFDFIDTGAIGSTDTHDDSEGDDLWTWDAQVRRGYADSIASTMRGRWLTYFKNGTYRADLIADDGNRGDLFPSTSADPFCHGYGAGLVTIGYLDSDVACITEAEAIADLGLTNLFGSTTVPGSGAPASGGRSTTALAATGHNMGVGGGRQMARIGQLVANLAYATGKAKWIGWLKAITDAYMGAANWADTSSGLGIVQGGAYFCDRNWMAVNGQQGTSAWDAGARSNSIYQYGMHAEFLWRSYLITKRSDVRDRLIALARFMQYYAHNPANTGSGGPFCSSYFGITAGGGYWHRDIPGAAHYDASIINILVWGYKLTGDAALLTRARVHLRQGTRWREGEPGAGVNPTPLCTATQVYDFIDTRRNGGGSIQFIDNKGQLQYAYNVFENGGDPTTLDSNVPTYIRNLTAGNGYAIPNSRLSDAFASFSGQSGPDISVYAYSGGCYDTSRNRFMIHGGGHNNYNGNGVFGFSLYGSETPTWSLFKPHTTPPSVTDVGSQASVETCPNGDPASSHTYNQIVYDEANDKLVLVGLGSAAGITGSNFSRMRFLNLTTNTWDAASSAFAGTSLSMFDAAYCYNETERAIYGRGAGSQGRWHRYDSVANTLTELTLSGAGAVSAAGDSTCAIDPIRQYGIWIGGFSVINGGPTDSGSVDMVLLDFSSRSGANITSYARSLSGFPSALRTSKYALEFHPPSGTFVAWISGNAIYRLIPPSNPFTGTWTFSTVTPGGDGLPTIASGDHGPSYGRFRWAPYPNDKSRGVFVCSVAQGSSGSYTASQTYIYKPNFETAPTSFSTTFSATENPISESGAWDRSATNFKAVRTTGGVAYAASYTDGNLDAYARLVPTAFTAPNDNYEVTCTVIRNSFGVASSETEILLRLSATGSTMNCYEVLYNNGGGELVQINGGGPGGYVEIGSTVFTFNAAEGTGDKIRARVTGTNPVVITAWAAPASNPTNWTQLFTYSDSSANRKQTGQPGMGFYTLTADNNLLNCGWQDFSVTSI